MKLGKFETNNIYLGDSYELIKEIPDKSVDLIYTDIPYLIGHGSTTGENQSAVSKRINKLVDDDLDGITDGINYSILDEFVRVMRYIYIYIWCSKEQILDLMNYFVGKHKCSFNLLVWCKTNPVPATNNNWLPDIEYCLVFKGKGAKAYNDGYELKSKYHISQINKGDKDLYNHPTIKPIELVKRHLLHSTQPNDIVADFYLGSGTTCVAAKQLGRQYIGFEINEKYFKIAQDRLNGINQKGEMNLFETDFEKVEQEHLEQMNLFGNGGDSNE